MIPAQQYRPATMVALALSSKSACRVGGSLPPRDKPYEIDEVIGAIDGVDAAIEIVDDRSCDYTTLDVPSRVSGLNFLSPYRALAWMRILEFPSLGTRDRQHK